MAGVAVIFQRNYYCSLLYGRGFRKEEWDTAACRTLESVKMKQMVRKGEATKN